MSHRSRSGRLFCLSTTTLLLLIAGCGKNDFLEPPPLVPDPIPIDVRYNPPSPTAEQPTDIEITVTNQGGLDAKKFDMRVEVWFGCCPDLIQFPVFITTVTFENGLLSGEAMLKVIPGYVFGSRGNYRVNVFIDPDEEIDENIPGSYDGETNNFYNCVDIIDNQGDTTLQANETCIRVVSVGSGGGGGGIIGIIPKAND